MTEIDEIQTEIALLEAWLRDHAITEDEFRRRKLRLELELRTLRASDGVTPGRLNARLHNGEGRLDQYGLDAPKEMKASPAHQTNRPTAMQILVMLLAVKSIVLGMKLYQGNLTDWHLGSSEGGESAMELSVLASRPAYEGCDLKIALRNPTAVSLNFIKLTVEAISQDDKVIGQARTEISDLESGDEKAVLLHFHHIGCVSIVRIRIPSLSQGLIVTGSSDTRLPLSANN